MTLIREGERPVFTTEMAIITARDAGTGTPRSSRSREVPLSSSTFQAGAVLWESWSSLINAVQPTSKLPTCSRRISKSTSGE